MSYDFFPKELATCRKCPRLADWREEVALKKRKAYQNVEYWGKPVPGFGDPNARILLLGLAPGAHGSNRTGRMFTGDASGDFLFPALHRAGLASQPIATDQNDGMELNDLFITAAARCVPPSNKPVREEVMNCQSWLAYDFSGLPNLKLVLALGSIAHDSYLEYLKKDIKIVKAKHKFSHGALHQFNTDQLNTDQFDIDSVIPVIPMLDAYHVSFQNTNTGRLTEEMFDIILAQAKEIASS